MLLLAGKHARVRFCGKFHELFVVPMDLAKLLVSELAVRQTTTDALLGNHVIRRGVLPLITWKIFDIEGRRLAFRSDISYWSGAFLVLV